MFSYEVITKNNIKMVKKKVITYWIISIIFIIFLGMLFLKYNMEFYYENKGIMIDENTIVVNILKEEEENIILNKKIKIGDNTFSYEIIDINDKTTHKEIIMKISTSKNIDHYNKIVSFKIEKFKRNILNEIFKYWRGKN